jgi:hypothetical protein
MAQKKKVAKKSAAKKTATKSGAAKAAAAKTSAAKTWVVTTSSDRPLAEIAKDLKAAGFKVDQTLDQIGIITGKSDDKAVGKARAVRGVTDVSAEQQVDIGPPGGRDTW